MSCEGPPAGAHFVHRGGARCRAQAKPTCQLWLCFVPSVVRGGFVGRLNLESPSSVLDCVHFAPTQDPRPPPPHWSHHPAPQSCLRTLSSRGVPRCVVAVFGARYPVQSGQVSGGGGQSHRSVTGVWVSPVSEGGLKLRILGSVLDCVGLPAWQRSRSVFCRGVACGGKYETRKKKNTGGFSGLARAKHQRSSASLLTGPSPLLLRRRHDAFLRREAAHPRHAR